MQLNDSGADSAPEPSGEFPPDLVMPAKAFALVCQLLLNVTALQDRYLAEAGLDFDEVRSAKALAFEVRRASEFLDSVRIRVADEPFGGVQEPAGLTGPSDADPSATDYPRPRLPSAAVSAIPPAASPSVTSPVRSSGPAEGSECTVYVHWPQEDGEYGVTVNWALMRAWQKMVGLVVEVFGAGEGGDRELSIRTGYTAGERQQAYEPLLRWPFTSGPGWW